MGFDKGFIFDPNEPAVDLSKDESSNHLEKAARGGYGADLHGDDNGEVRELLFAMKKYADSEIVLDFTQSLSMLPSSRSKFRGAHS